MKVFCIGFHKTGTTSLAVALETLGYRVTGPNGTEDPHIARNVYELVDSLVPQYDAFQDNPWPVLFEYLDRKYPASKFVLTVRTPDSWIGSVVKHFGNRKTPMREWIYGAGCPAGNESIYLDRFRRHNDSVREYFRERPDDFLVLDLEKEEGWAQLCPFLGVEALRGPFPHANSARQREESKRLAAQGQSPDRGLIRRLRGLFS